MAGQANRKEQGYAKQPEAGSFQLAQTRAQQGLGRVEGVVDLQSRGRGGPFVFARDRSRETCWIDLEDFCRFSRNIGGTFRFERGAKEKRRFEAQRGARFLGGYGSEHGSVLGSIQADLITGLIGWNKVGLGLGGIEPVPSFDQNGSFQPTGVCDRFGEVRALFLEPSLGASDCAEVKNGETGQKGQNQDRREETTVAAQAPFAIPSPSPQGPDAKKYAEQGDNDPDPSCRTGCAQGKLKDEFKNLDVVHDGRLASTHLRIA